MIFPDTANPKFVAWYNAQSSGVKASIDAAWDDTMNNGALFPGHKSAEYARLTFLIQHCREQHGYA